MEILYAVRLVPIYRSIFLESFCIELNFPKKNQRLQDTYTLNNIDIHLTEEHMGQFPTIENKKQAR